MPTGYMIDSSHATCQVNHKGEWTTGRYKWTRDDGMMVVEIKTIHDAKTRKLFKPEDIQLYPGTEEVVR